MGSSTAFSDLRHDKMIAAVMAFFLVVAQQTPDECSLATLRDVVKDEFVHDCTAVNSAVREILKTGALTHIVDGAAKILLTDNVVEAISAAAVACAKICAMLYSMAAATMQSVIYGAWRTQECAPPAPVGLHKTECIQQCQAAT